MTAASEFGRIVATEITPALIGLFFGYKFWKSLKNKKKSEVET